MIDNSYSSDNSPILYVLIGNPDDCEEIGHYPERGTSKTIINEAQQIFTKLSNSGIKTKDLRNKVNNKDKGNYFFTINSKNIFYLIYADTPVKEREAFELIENLQQENIPLLIDSKNGKLNLYGRQQLKLLVEDFASKNNRINDIQIEVDEVKNAMKKNIQKMAVNVENVENLEQKAIDLKRGADEYNNSATQLRKATWWSNCKWCIILAVVVILLIVIILPVSLKK